MRVRFVESAEKYNHRLSIGQDVLLPIPLPHLEPIEECVCDCVCCSITRVLRSNDATATRKSLEKWVCTLLVFIAIFPTHLLYQKNVGKPSWSWIPMEHIHGHIQVSKEKLDFHHCLFMFSIKHEIGHFHVVVMQIRQRNVQKVWCTFKVVVLTFSLPSRCWMNGSLSPYSYTWHVLCHYIVQLMLKMMRATCRQLDQRILLYM